MCQTLTIICGPVCSRSLSAVGGCEDCGDNDAVRSWRWLFSSLPGSRCPGLVFVWQLKQVLQDGEAQQCGAEWALQEGLAVLCEDLAEPAGEQETQTHWYNTVLNFHPLFLRNLGFYDVASRTTFSLLRCSDTYRLQQDLCV